jgi:GTPase SAR1 family protein
MAGETTSFLKLNTITMNTLFNESNLELKQASKFTGLKQTPIIIPGLKQAPSTISQAFNASEALTEASYNYVRTNKADLSLHRLFKGRFTTSQRKRISAIKKQINHKYVLQSQPFPDITSSQGISHLLGFKYSIKDVIKANEYYLKLLEDLLTLFKMLSTVQTLDDTIFAIGNYIKLRFPVALFGSEMSEIATTYFKKLFYPTVQNAEEIFPYLRKLLDNYDEVKNSPVVQKIYKFFLYLISLSVLDEFGITMDNLRYGKIEQEALKKKYCMGADMLYVITDTILFLCERGYQCMKTGSMDPIYHSGNSYTEWFNSANKLKVQVLQLNEPALHGFSESSFIRNLERTIEQGDAMFKHATRVSAYERGAIKSIVHDLRIMQCEQMSSKRARENRRLPFSVLIAGPSSVGKSTITNMLFHQYARLFKLDSSDEFKYTKNPVAKYWDGFKTYMWCLLMDDVAFMHPNKATQGDPTVMEMIQVVNYIPFVPDQAGLADKGRTPLRCEFVMATTNTENLNAYAYFACPLAVQRRLPHVITVVPKPEYATNGMLDSSKTPTITNDYPDYWIWTIKKVVPVGDNRGETKVEFTFNSINDFLKWFNKAAVDHDRVQNLVAESNDTFSRVQLCDQCFLPSCDCDNIDSITCSGCLNVRCSCVRTQSYDMFEPKVLVQYSFFIFWLILFLYSLFDIIPKCIMLNKLRRYRNYWRSVIITQKRFWQRFGNRVQNSIGKNPRLERIAVGCAIGSTLFYVGSKLYTSYCKKPKVILQSEVISTESAPKAKSDDKVNVWYKEDFSLSKFDVSTATLSNANKSARELAEIISSNCVNIVTHRLEDNVIVRRPTKGVYLGGFLVAFNNHAIPDNDFELSLVQSNVEIGITPNTKFPVYQDSVIRFPERDLCVIRFLGLPPKKKIINYFAKESFKAPCKGLYVSRDNTGTTCYSNIDNIQYLSNGQFDGIAAKDFFIGKVITPTINGDCGSVMIAETGYGPCVLGFHCLGGGNDVLSVKLDLEFVTSLYEKYEASTSAPGMPELSAPSALKVLGELHPKSKFRFIKDGAANVYGSYKGFRVKQKSSVEPTIIQDAMLKRGYQVKFTKPDMSWRPWNIAAEAMVKPINKINSCILDTVTGNFIDDILLQLTPEMLAEVHVYDDFTTVNGAAGVEFVDKMNRSTSMGSPWCTGKRKFLRCIPARGGNLDPMEFTSEVMDRVKIMITKYENGQRCMPIFSGNLKDEPVPFAKAASGKTRVMFSCPVDFSFVCRKYTLSVVRLIMQNPAIFESGPGTVAQSTQWQNIRTRVSAFGEDRIIEGDYKAFDKNTSPEMIRAAFRVLHAICAAAGYTEAELKVINSIGFDLSFPVVDLDGCLAELFGSSPSGYPLTVIVNGIINSLYLRYAYAVLKKTNEASDFRKNVHLATFGDDMIAGVSKRISFYTHTTIQQALSDIGCVFTMGDKLAESVPFINMRDATFLKRKWVYDGDVGAYLCPLDETSIEKSLMMCVYSKKVTREHQIMSVISSAVREYFFYGKKIFHKKRALLMDVVEECDLSLYVQPSTFPSWASLYNNFWEASGITVGTIDDVDDAIIDYSLQSLDIVEPIYTCDTFVKSLNGAPDNIMSTTMFMIIMYMVTIIYECFLFLYIIYNIRKCVVVYKSIYIFMYIFLVLYFPHFGWHFISFIIQSMYIKMPFIVIKHNFRRFF